MITLITNIIAMFFLGGNIYVQKSDNSVTLSDSSVNPPVEVVMSFCHWMQMCYAIVRGERLHQKIIGPICLMMVKHNRKKCMAVISDSVTIFVTRQDYNGLTNLALCDVHRHKRRAAAKQRSALKKMRHLQL